MSFCGRFTSLSIVSSRCMHLVLASIQIPLLLGLSNTVGESSFKVERVKGLAAASPLNLFWAPSLGASVCSCRDSDSHPADKDPGLGIRNRAPAPLGEEVLVLGPMTALQLSLS